VAAPTPGHRTALLDWLACAAGGREQRAARAARALGDGLGERIAAAGTAGHVLDYDDTYLPGLAHLSAPVAPVAVLLGAERGATAADGLQAKFSIPYLTAYSLLHGPPRLAAFDAVDEAARALAHRIELRTDDTLLESEAVLEAGGERAGHVGAALGSPARPMDEAALRAKLRELAGSRLDGALDDLGVPAAALAAAAGLP
jgi:2-methylcitrate dehydratase PrpD